MLYLIVESDCLNCENAYWSGTKARSALPPLLRISTTLTAGSTTQAGRNGKFGLVIGVTRERNRTALLEHAADVVVEDLADIHLATEGDAHSTPTRA